MTLALFLLSLLKGGLHAFDPDHLAAMALLQTEQQTAQPTGQPHGQHGRHQPRQQPRQQIHQGGRRAMFFWRAFYWGLGHGLTLLVAVTLLWRLRTQLPAVTLPLVNMLIGLMMIALAAHALWRLYRLRLHIHYHQHPHHMAGGKVGHIHVHAHATTADHQHRHFFDAPAAMTMAGRAATPRSYRQALAMGVVHGLAGSAEVLLLSLVMVDSWGQVFVTLLLFSVGCLAGMVLLSSLMAAPLQWLERSMARTYHALSAATALVALAVGGHLMLPALLLVM